MNAVNRRRAIKFLESKKVSKTFKTTALDFFKLNLRVRDNNFKSYLARTEPRHLIDGAFRWADAVYEHPQYWKDMSYEWINHLENKGRATWREKILSIFY